MGPRLSWIFAALLVAGLFSPPTLAAPEPVVLFEIKAADDTTAVDGSVPGRRCVAQPALGTFFCYSVLPGAAAVAEEGMVVRRLAHPAAAALLGAIVFRAYFNPLDLVEALPIPEPVKEFERSRVAAENFFLAYLAVELLPAPLARRVLPPLLIGRPGQIRGPAGMTLAEAAAGPPKGKGPRKPDPERPKRSLEEIMHDVERGLEAVKDRVQRLPRAGLTTAQRAELNKITATVRGLGSRSVRDARQAEKLLEQVKALDRHAAEVLKTL